MVGIGLLGEHNAPGVMDRAPRWEPGSCGSDRTPGVETGLLGGDRSPWWHKAPGVMDRTSGFIDRAPGWG